MNILMVGPSRKANGGMTTVVNNYFNSSLAKIDKIIYVATMKNTNVFLKTLMTFIAYIKVMFFLIFNHIDIVHVHMSHRGSFYRKSIIVLMAKLFKTKVIIHLHGSRFDVFYENETNDSQKKYIKKIFNMTDCVIVLSEEWREIINKWVDTKIQVLYNAIEIPESNNYNKNSKYITLLGRLNERKGVYDLLEVIADVKKHRKDIKFILAGDGDLEKLRRKIYEKGLDDDSVQVLGWIDNKRKYEILKETIIYVLPSYHEGMPMSILEAMSYGIPVISTYIGGIPRVVKNEFNGNLINPGDTANLYKFIVELLDDEQKRVSYSKHAYMNIKSNFGIETHIKRLRELYMNL